MSSAGDSSHLLGFLPRILWFLFFAMLGFLPDALAQAESGEVPCGKIHAYAMDLYHRLRIAAPAPSTNLPGPCRLNLTPLRAPASTRPTVQLTGPVASINPSSVPPISLSARRILQDMSLSVPVTVVVKPVQGNPVATLALLRSDSIRGAGNRAVDSAAAGRRDHLSVVLGKESRLAEFHSAQVQFRGSALPMAERAGITLQGRPFSPMESSEALGVVYSGASNMLINAIASLRLNADIPGGLSGYKHSAISLMFAQPPWPKNGADVITVKGNNSRDPVASISSGISLALNSEASGSDFLPYTVSSPVVSESNAIPRADVVQLAFASAGAAGTMSDIPVLTFRQTEASRPSVLETISVELNTSHDGNVIAVRVLAPPVNPYMASVLRSDERPGFQLRSLTFDQWPSVGEIRIKSSLTDQGLSSAAMPLPFPVEWEAKRFGDSASNIHLLILTGHARADMTAAAAGLTPIEVKLASGALAASVETFQLNLPANGPSGSPDIRHVLLHSGAPSVRPPWNLKTPTAWMADSQALDSMLISNVFEEVKQGKVNKRNPELRKQLVWYIQAYPFSQDAYDVFVFIIDNAGGNTLNKRIASLEVWAREYEGGRYASIFSYYIVYHLYRIKNYDGAVARIADYTGRFQEYRDRLAMLEALCALQKNNPTRALAMLQKVQQEYPDSTLVPEAVFLTGWIYYQDNNRQEAQTILRELIAKYPSSVSATKARVLLAGLKEPL